MTYREKNSIDLKFERAEVEENYLMKGDNHK
jgi:hypothetical protein